MKQYIAIDLGAESGRVMLGSVTADKLRLEQVWRFQNKAVEEASSLRWDFGKLLAEVRTGIAKAVALAGGAISGIGIDSWGVDFGLLDSEGKLIENPYHYRDDRTSAMMRKAYRLMPKHRIYRHTGVQFLQFNTLYQLLAMRLNNPDVLNRAKNLIFIADLVAYHLGSQVFAEHTLASTSQLMDVRTGRWSKAIFEKMLLPIEIMPEIVKAGTIVGRLSREAMGEAGCRPIPIIAAAAHDTACAVAAVPAVDSNWAYLSSGTWSLLGVEVPQPITSSKSFKYSFTNEAGVEDTIRLLKNVMGLWLVQECRKQWQEDKARLPYSELTEMARAAKPFAAYLDPDNDEFLLPGNMPDKINCFLSKTGQKTINDKGQMVRVILESLAMKYRWAVEKLEDITEVAIDCLYMVGGGVQNELLCQFTADAVGKTVYAGLAEATAIGNVLMQARAARQIKNLTRGREIVRNSFELKEYQPREKLLWTEKYHQIRKKWSQQYSRLQN